MSMSTRFLLLALTLTPVSSRAVVWNVNPQGTGDAPTIQAAYDAAGAGDLIVLAPGVYIDSNTRVIHGFGAGEFPSTTATAFMKAGVDLESSSGAEATIIDGQNARHGLIGPDVTPASIRGVTFLNCVSAGTYGGTEKWGGGVLIYRSQATIQDCRFVQCIGLFGGGGGGVFFSQGSGGILRGNLFLRCHSGDLGGGVEIFLHDGAVVENNTFVDNSTVDHGGAILFNSSSATLDNNIFAGNTAGLSGGAVGCLYDNPMTASCNLFWENDAPSLDDVMECNVVIGQNDNIVTDPLFCDAPADNYTIDAFSPASPNNPNGCGLIGAYGVGCGPVSVESKTWGVIKSLYR